jgi:hypothetical protein
MKQTILSVLLLVTASLVGFGRFHVPGHDLSLAGTYEAFAHIWIGIALTLAVVYWHSFAGKLSAVLLVGLTVLETVMFLIR